MEEQNLKKVMYALIAVAVLLAGTLAYLWYQKSSLVKDLTMEKEELTEQEKMVIELRYGLFGGPPMRQREVADKTGISRSYVSRIEKRALEKLRAALTGGEEL